MAGMATVYEAQIRKIGPNICHAKSDRVDAASISGFTFRLYTIGSSSGGARLEDVHLESGST